MKKKEASEAQLAEQGWYKGYDVRWLRNESEHPDYYLVAEYDKKYGKKE